MKKPAPPRSESDEPIGPLSEVFSLIVKIGLAHGGTSIKDLPGCWTYQENDTFIAVNGHMDATHWVEVHHGAKLGIPPGNAAICINGWLVHLGSPFSGLVLMIPEDELIERLEKIAAH